MSTDAPTRTEFTPSGRVDVDVVTWVKVPDTYPCAECLERGGWLPRVDQDLCPECMGADPYGQSSYCAECEYCCGC